MYRGLALKGLKQNVSLGDEAGLEALARNTHIELRQPTAEQEAAGAKNRVFLDGDEVTEAIRTAEVAKAASLLAPIAGARRGLVAEQHRAGAGGGASMEGGDIGTVEFPLAELKIVRAGRPEGHAARR